MKPLEKIMQIEFEARIFVSFFIVIFVCVVSFIPFADHRPVYKIISDLSGLSDHSSIFFLIASVSMFLISLLRMWAGSLLSSITVMSFKVRTESLITSGPYSLVRNPIYFSDWLAMCVFVLFMPFTGILLPVLFYLHYRQLIIYEEKSFIKITARNYDEYLKKVPCLIPTPESFLSFIKSRSKLIINPDGFRHNALYILFIPGFIAGYFTGSFLWSVLIGLPGVIDWAIVHTKIGLPKSVKKSKVFKSVLYSQCWEDPLLDRKAFNISKDDVVFSITSGGCNLLTFLIDDPAKVIALDLNQHQNYLLELKTAAYKHLTYDHILEFYGVRNSGNRRNYFDTVKSSLSERAKEYWEKNIKLIEKGIIHCGRYENYIRLLRITLHRIIGKNNISRIFHCENRDERKILFEKKWENLRWKIFSGILLSRRTMSLLFDKGFFKYLDQDFSFGDHFAQKVKRAFTELSVNENYFLHYILFGNYDEKFLPPYLKKENYEIIKSRLDRIEIISDSCENFFNNLPDNSISRFNFTNIFEWMSEDAFEKLLEETIRVAKNNAIITYRNLLVRREHPAVFSENISSDRQLAWELYQKDLSFIYNSYVVEKIHKDEKICLTELLLYQPEES